MKKILSIILSLAMVLSLTTALPISAVGFEMEQAEPAFQDDLVLEPLGTNDVIASGYCGGEGDGTNLSWKLIDDGTLTISGKGEMANFEWDKSPWHTYADYIASVVIEPGVTSIGDYAFQGNSAMTSISIPEGVIRIGTWSIGACPELRAVSIPDSVTTLQGSAFGWCISLTSIELSKNVTNIIGNPFVGCLSVSVITIDEANPAYCNVDGVMFTKDLTAIICYPAGIQVSSYRIPSGVTTLQNEAFGGCMNLKSVVIPKSVTSMWWRVFGVTGLTDIYCEAKSKPEGWGDNWTLDCDATVHWGYNSTTDEAKIVLGTAAGTVGKTFEIPVSLESNPGIVSMRLSVEYDTSVMKLTSIKDAGKLGKAAHNPNGNVLMWENDTATENFTSIGEIATLCFTVNDDVESGRYLVTVSYNLDSYDITDVDINIVPFEVVGGYADIHSHTFAGNWYSNKEGHWQECSCGEKGEIFAHDFDWTITKEPTEDESGIETGVCSICKYETERVVPEKGHKHDFGGEWFADSENHWHECRCGEKRDIAAHTWDGGKVTKPATENETGIMTYTCTVCAGTKTDTIPKLESTTDAQIVIGTAEGAAGETVEVPVSLKANPGVISMLLKVKYDTNVMTLTEVKDSGNLGKSAHHNDVLSWENDTSTENYTYNGEIAKLYFTINDDAKAGKGEVTITYDLDNYEIMDVDMNPVKFDVVAGYVKVHVHSFTDKWFSDETNHWHECSCGKKNDIAAHTWDEGKVTTPPTYTSNGIKAFTCTECKGTKTKVIPRLTDAQIIVGTAATARGGVIEIPVSLNKNTGIISMLLSVKYDSSVMKLTGVKDSGNLGKANHSAESNVLSWKNDTATSNITFNGEIAKLCFTVNENANLGESVVTVEYSYDNYDILDLDMNSVPFNVVDGSVNVIKVLYGDVDNDGKVTAKDRVTLARYLAKIPGYENINEAAADVDNDGRITAKDRVTIARHIAGWDDYKELPYTGK